VTPTDAQASTSTQETPTDAQASVSPHLLTNGGEMQLQYPESGMQITMCLW